MGTEATRSCSILDSTTTAMFPGTTSYDDIGTTVEEEEAAEGARWVP